MGVVGKCSDMEKGSNPLSSDFYMSAVAQVKVRLPRKQEIESSSPGSFKNVAFTFASFLPPDEPFHNFGTLKSVARRS